MATVEPNTPEWAAQICLDTIRRDAPLIEKYDNYLAGKQKPVYIPDNADAEFKALAKRSPLNMLPLVINSVTQVCYVDAIRHSRAIPDGIDEAGEELPPEMVSWQRNRMDARQMPIVRALAAHGLVYTLTIDDPRAKQGKKRARYEAYTAAQATAIYDDPVNDVDPAWGLVIKRGDATTPITAWLFNESDWWIVTQGKNGLEFEAKGKHGMSACPISRSCLHMDLRGTPVGLIAPVIPTQDQINQTSFDALTTQSYGSFKVRTATGMALPIRRWSRAEINAVFPARPGPDATAEEMDEWLSMDIPSVGDPILDENGQEIPLPVSVSQKRFLTAEDPDTKFGTLDETNLQPILMALDARIKYLAAQTQTPPTYFMGELANLSAEALQAAEISKTRRDGEIRMVLAEMYERMVSLGMELEDRDERAGDVGTEIVWADTDPRSLSATVDALGKMVEMLQVPPTAAWEELPGMTQGKFVHWTQLKRAWDAAHPEVELFEKLGDMGGFDQAMSGVGANGGDY